MPFDLMHSRRAMNHVRNSHREKVHIETRASRGKILWLPNFLRTAATDQPNQELPGWVGAALFFNNSSFSSS